MADEMVLKTQKWVNAMYGGTTGYYAENIPENGKTGWTTIYALTRALQIELGITNTADSFGPTTISKFNARFPNGIKQQEDNDESESNIYSIIQGALWCKGYSTGASGITKHFYGGTGGAIKRLKADAGCSDTSSTVTLNVMKALLSMDQFVKVSSGTNTIRTIQQNLNRNYEAYIGLAPCDGLYGRQMNKAMIKVLQAIEGYSVEDATGNFGSGTKANLDTIPDTNKYTNQQKAKAIELIRYALCCNGEVVSIESDVLNTWDANLRRHIVDFQTNLCLNVTGVCDVDTWMSLLLSKGNPDRSCIACDTRFEITDEVAQYLKNSGYQIVGRYLTGGDFKELRINEPQRILDAGLKLFLIFQESTTNLSYFTEARGKQDAEKAVKAAKRHRIPKFNIIYFAVDTDPTSEQISTYILPYFKAISENMGVYYKIGVYGTRNVCSQVMNAGYAETCFVSDMSTGYSGNMGFKIPSNWNLDQFDEISNISINGSDTIDLDKVAYSGRFPVVEALYKKIINYINEIRTLEGLYLQYKSSKGHPCDTNQLILGITNFLRSFKYGSTFWYAATLTSIDTDFINYVKDNNITLYNSLSEYANSDNKSLCDNYDGFIDIGHLAATIEGYISATSVPDFWFGWGGDLASIMEQINPSNGETNLDVARRLIGQDNSKFSYPDICSDADAIKIAQILQNPSQVHPFSSALEEYYLNYAQYRIAYYLLDLNNVSLNLEDLKNAIQNKMSGIFENTILIPLLGQTINANVKDACYQAFAEYILDNYPNLIGDEPILG